MNVITDKYVGEVQGISIGPELDKGRALLLGHLGYCNITLARYTAEEAKKIMEELSTAQISVLEGDWSSFLVDFTCSTIRYKSVSTGTGEYYIP